MKRCILIILTITVFFACNNDEKPVINVNTEAVLYRLLPKPKSLSFSESHFIMARDKAADISIASESLRFSAERFAKLMKEKTGASFNISINNKLGNNELTIGNGECSDITIESQNEEAYRLISSEKGIILKGNSNKAVFWGLMTLFQASFTEKELTVFPGMEIVDEPHYKWRGFQVDLGRAPMSADKLKQLIRLCSIYKLNFFIFREGDDELNAVRYAGNKLGTNNPYSFSMEEVKGFIDYAGQYNIALLPEIESMGHSAGKGFHYPELLEGGFLQTYCESIGHWRKKNLITSKSGSFDLMASIYNEWIPVLPEPVMHIGMDEILIPMEKQETYFNLLLPLLDSLAKMHEKDIKVWMWSDGPEGDANYHDMIVRCLWSYGEEPRPNLDNERLKIQRIEMLSKPDCQQEVVMAGGSGSEHVPYSKCDYNRAFRNLKQWALYGSDKDNFIGLFAVQWSSNELEMWVPDFVKCANVAWNPNYKSMKFKADFECIMSSLEGLSEFQFENSEEADQPTWNAITIVDSAFYKDIMTGTICTP